MNLFTDLFQNSDFHFEYPFLLLAIVLGIAGYFFFPSKERRNIRRVRRLVKAEEPLTPDEFLAVRRDKDERDPRYEGIYVFHNHTRRKYYVGQGMNVSDRIFQHLSGHGNGDVYADLVYGDRFSIKTVPLKWSGFRNLDELERYAIRAFRAWERGYNRNRGIGPTK